jgi:hypothetical protein
MVVVGMAATPFLHAADLAVAMHLLLPLRTMALTNVSVLV